jgi:hypothetical protein
VESVKMRKWMLVEIGTKGVGREEGERRKQLKESEIL